MESRLWLFSAAHYEQVRQACEEKSEIEILGQKYAVTSCKWDVLRGGYYMVMPLIRLQERAETSTDLDAAFRAIHEWRSPVHDGPTGAAE